MKKNRSVFLCFVITFCLLSIPRISFTQGTFVDHRDNKRYKYVQIGEQIWMAENLFYNCGKGCGQFKPTSDIFYNWEKAKVVCPSGWHLPSDKEWQVMENRLGMNSSELAIDDQRESGMVGQKLKSKTGWVIPNSFYDKGGIDQYGFNAKTGGMFQAFSKRMLEYDTCVFFWTRSSATMDDAWSRSLHAYIDGVERSTLDKAHGAFVRCIKD